MRTTHNQFTIIIYRHAIQIAIREVTVLTILWVVTIVWGTFAITIFSVVMSFLTHIVSHHLGEYCREVHTDTHVLHLVTHIGSEGNHIVHIEIVAVQCIALILFLDTLLDKGATDLVVRSLTIAAVDEETLHLVAVITTAVASLFILVHGQHRHLQHGVRQQGVIPFCGIH